MLRKKACYCSSIESLPVINMSSGEVKYHGLMESSTPYVIVADGDTNEEIPANVTWHLTHNPASVVAQETQIFKRCIGL